MSTFPSNARSYQVSMIPSSLHLIWDKFFFNHGSFSSLYINGGDESIKYIIILINYVSIQYIIILIAFTDDNTLQLG